MPKKANQYDYLIVYQYIINNGCAKISSENNTEDITDGLILPSVVNPEKELIKRDNYKNLSEEAKTIIDIVLNSPQEVLTLFTTPKHKRISLRRLKEILSKNWQSPIIVENSIEEIKKWVKSL